MTSKIRAVDVHRATGDLPEDVNYAIKASTPAPLVATMSERHDPDIHVALAGTGSFADIVSRIQHSVMMVVSQ